MPRPRFILLLTVALLAFTGCANRTDNSVTVPSRFLQSFDFQQFFTTHLAPLVIGGSAKVHISNRPGHSESASGAFATLRPIPNYDPRQWDYLDRSSQYHTVTFLAAPDRLTPLMETTVRELEGLIAAGGGERMGRHGSTTVGTSDQLDAAAEVTLDYHDNQNFGTVTLLLIKTDQAQGYALTVIINEVD